MYEKIIEDEDGKTTHQYSDCDLCLRVIDEDNKGNIISEIVYLHKDENIKGWIEFKSGTPMRFYIVDESERTRKVLVFDRSGELVEESQFDDD